MIALFLMRLWQRPDPHPKMNRKRTRQIKRIPVAAHDNLSGSVAQDGPHRTLTTGDQPRRRLRKGSAIEPKRAKYLYSPVSAVVSLNAPAGIEVIKLFSSNLWPQKGIAMTEPQPYQGGPPKKQRV